MCLLRFTQGKHGHIPETDNLRAIREETFFFEADESLVGEEGMHDDSTLTSLSIITSHDREYVFFEEWRKKNDQQTFRQMKGEKEVRSEAGMLSVPDIRFLLSLTCSG